MTAVALGLVVGYLGGRLCWMAFASLFEHPLLVRANYRGRGVPTGAGIALVVVALAVEGGRAVAASFGVGDGAGLLGSRGLVLLAVVGFGVLGIVDDLLGSGAPGGQAGIEKGFRGHLGAMAHGRLSTGALKLVGGGVLAIIVVAPAVGESPARLAVDALLVALCANTTNLLDRAPGRATKFASVSFVAIALATVGAPGLGAIAVVVGASLGLLPTELHERLMLGDAGANPLGAVVGLGLVLACGTVVRDLALVVVVVMNIAGELVSLGGVVESTPIVRAFDRAGRLRH